MWLFAFLASPVKPSYHFRVWRIWCSSRFTPSVCGIMTSVKAPFLRVGSELSRLNSSIWSFRITSTWERYNSDNCGTLTNLANRSTALNCPAVVNSNEGMIWPNVPANSSNVVKLMSCSLSSPIKRKAVHASAIVLLMGVPVASSTRPPLRCTVRHLVSACKASCEPWVSMPFMERRRVSNPKRLLVCHSSMTTQSMPNCPK